jgi:hypothetical protein
MSTQEKIILPESVEAAHFVTGISGWVDRDGVFWGKDERRVRRLPWDVARCTGENNFGECAARHDCRRHTEFDDAGPLTLKFEAPLDAPLSAACELILPYNAKLTRAR